MLYCSSIRIITIDHTGGLPTFVDSSTLLDSTHSEHNSKFPSADSKIMLRSTSHHGLLTSFIQR